MDGVIDGLRVAAFEEEENAEARDVTLIRGERRKEPIPEPEEEVTLTLVRKAEKNATYLFRK